MNAFDTRLIKSCLFNAISYNQLDIYQERDTGCY